jgi:hypothetical protein
MSRLKFDRNRKFFSKTGPRDRSHDRSSGYKAETLKMNSRKWLVVNCFISFLRKCFPHGDVSVAVVTEKSDSRKILTPGSFFYVEM